MWTAIETQLHARDVLQLRISSLNIGQMISALPVISALDRAFPPDAGVDPGLDLVAVPGRAAGYKFAQPAIAHQVDVAGVDALIGASAGYPA